MREISWPDPIDVASTPSIIGSSRSPDSLGEAASTVWKYSGRNVTGPNSAKPTISDSAPAVVNTRSRHSAGGSTGSAARVSTMPKAISASAPSAAVDTTSNEPQSQVVPPSDVTSTIDDKPSASSPEPR